MPLIEVDNARFHPCMDSFLGALHGVLKSQNDERDMDELWGLSCLGFRTQIHRRMAPAGLFGRQWDETYSRILYRLGYDCIAGLRDSFYTPKDLRELQFAWMDTLEKALNDGRPAITFGLHGPAFGIIRGLDNDAEEYHVSTFLDGRQDAPINVQDVGSQSPPLIFMLIPTGPIPDYDSDKAAMGSLREAVDHHLGQEHDSGGNLLSAPPDLVAGPAAYNAWSTAIETGQVDTHWGPSYYAGYYAEARSSAAQWLRRLSASPTWSADAQSLNRAAAHFDHEVECFGKLPGLFPLNEPSAIQDPGRRTEASACLRAARAEHIAGLEIIVEMVNNRGL